MKNYKSPTSTVIYSDKFKRVLSKMDNDPLSKELLRIENTNLDVVTNFIDVKDEDGDVLTFTPDRVAQSILNSKEEAVEYNGRVGGWLSNNIEANRLIFNSLKYQPKSGTVYRPNVGESGLVISKSISEETGKTWCYVKFKNGEGIYNADKLKPVIKDLKKVAFTKSRQEIRVGRLVRNLFKSANFTVVESQVEKFVNDFRATLAVINDVFSNFELVSGDDLGFWYHKKNYLDPNIGTLSSSCQAVGRLDWLEIYIKNPDTVKLLILRSSDNYDKIVGRSLIWKLEEGSETSHMMDYIYTSRDSDKKIFLDYAQNKGWNSRENNYNKTYVAYVKPMTFKKYPSVDTMNNWDPSTGKISNQSFPGCKAIIWTQNDDED